MNADWATGLVVRDRLNAIKIERRYAVQVTDQMLFVVISNVHCKTIDNRSSEE